MKKHMFIVIAFLLIVVSTSFQVCAAQNQKNTDAKKKAYRLSPITVQEQRAGEIVLDKTTLDMTPSTTLSVTDALRSKSSVQFDSMSRDAFTGGAITPPKISIRGAHHYENNFTINGMSNNNVLNPGGFDEGEPFGLVLPSGDSQAMFISTDLLDSVEAYTENISAAYGDFLGGVVDAKYRDASTDRWHISLSTRHTRDTWAEQHYFEGNTPDDYPASQDGQHSRFKRTNLSAIVDGPISDHFGLIVAYDRKWSKIPTYMYLQGPEKTTDRRLNENYFIRLNAMFGESLKADLTGTYAPYSAKMHPLLQRGGKYEIKGGGYSLGLETEWTLPCGMWENNLSFSVSEVSKDSNSNTFYQWLSKPGGIQSTYANWTDRRLANEGMMGDIESIQKVYELKSHFHFKEFDTASVTHKVLAGLDFTSLRAESETTGYTNYYRPTAQAGVRGRIEDGVVTGEQYSKGKRIVPEDSRAQGYKTAALFLEDSMNIERFLVRPGVRLSWDDITEETNLAPRLFANVDILNDKRFNLFGGYNKYYGSQVLNHAMSMPLKFTLYSRKFNAGALSGWKEVRSSEKDSNELGDLKTPYVHEYTIGTSALVWETLFDVTFVDRRYKDQIRTYFDRTGKKNKRYTNEGETTYWGITLNIKRVFDFGAFGQHRCELAATHSSSKSNYASWLDAYDEMDSDTDSAYVELDGELVGREELPVGNFAAPWVMTYTQEMFFWDGRFRVMPMLRYETGGETIASLKKPRQVMAPDGKMADRYEIRDRRDNFTMDLSAALDVLDYNEHVLTVEMDITNVFDKKNIINVDPDSASYAMGRQIYAGLKYTF
ncbi:MAG: hypothetical protein CSA21_02490 [Deltaproteobacteria bacterium]|nr:MAG: hypothetical protein CSA21_02490 [Deltaproteobacteria bacterium]